MFYLWSKVNWSPELKKKISARKILEKIQFGFLMDFPLVKQKKDINRKDLFSQACYFCLAKIITRLKIFVRSPLQ